ncbi:MAG: hypothetical protein GW818_05140 [Flavobacteriales bacterium]|nr:hypothetical protein [Flavobacteriales bacterium]PJC61786.1 MAG: hypothetical protein CO022_08015 [Flavobacteriales bacterium CG_4_9_14_0_2_um_filter_32_27]
MSKFAPLFFMMLRKTLIIFLLLLTLSFVPHNYYVTITEIAYNSSNKKMEISLKFIGHDLEYALEKEGFPNMFLGTEKELEKANDFIYQYINQHFEIKTDENMLLYKLIGKEVNNDDFIYCYIETESIDNFSTVEIKNTLLNNYFKEHINIVYLTVGEQRFNFRLNNEKTKEKHTIIN